MSATRVVSVAALSAASGVPVGTIERYLREWLLPPGRLVAPGEVRYGAEHLRRLALITALVEVGGHSPAQVRAIVAAADAAEPAAVLLGEEGVGREDAAAGGLLADVMATALRRLSRLGRPGQSGSQSGQSGRLSRR